MSEEGKVKAKVNKKLGGEKKKMTRKNKKKSKGFVAAAVVVASVVVAVTVVVGVSASTPVPTTSSSMRAGASLQNWFNAHGYDIDVHTDETGIETFAGGKNYSVVLLDEVTCGYASRNIFGWYSTLENTTLIQLFAGKDSAGATAEFSPSTDFGCYLTSPDGTFYTENELSSDGFDHAWVFEDPKNPGRYIVAWEDLKGGGDKDYEDMIVSLAPKETTAISVTTDRENYTIGETVLMTLAINRSAESAREMQLELELKEPFDEPDLIYNSGAFWMPAEFKWNATVPFPIPYTFWIPSGEYCFIGTLRDPTTGEEIASDRACFEIDDNPWIKTEEKLRGSSSGLLELELP